MSKPRSSERWRQLSPRRQRIGTVGCIVSYIVFFVLIGASMAVLLPFGRVLDIVMGVLTVIAGVLPLPSVYREAQRLTGPPDPITDEAEARCE